MINIIVAVDDDYLIGKEGSLNGMPWDNKEDLKHFKETTLNKTIVMGKKTYLAIGRPLPKRKNIVVTRQGLDDDRVEVRDDLKAVIMEYKTKGQDLYITGGASIYQQALPLADQLLISRIPGKHTGDTYFPRFENLGFKLVEKKQYQTFTLEIYRKESI